MTGTSPSGNFPGDHFGSSFDPGSAGNPPLPSGRSRCQHSLVAGPVGHSGPPVTTVRLAHPARRQTPSTPGIRSLRRAPVVAPMNPERSPGRGRGQPISGLVPSSEACKPAHVLDRHMPHLTPCGRGAPGASLGAGGPGREHHRARGHQDGRTAAPRPDPASEGSPPHPPLAVQEEGLRLREPKRKTRWVDVKKRFRRAVEAAELHGLWFHDLRRPARGSPTTRDCARTSSG